MKAYDFVLHRHWAIEPSALHTIGMIAARQNNLEEARKIMAEKPEMPSASIKGRRLDGTRSTIIYKNVACIPLCGPVFPRANMMTEFSGATSLSVFKSDLIAAAEADDIDAIIIDIDSPGGVASGVAEAAELIREVSQTKPVYAYVSGMAASAAYWLASAATEIVAHRSAELGSIGVVCGVPVQENADQEGYRTFEIVSTNAENKRPDPRTDNGLEVIKGQLDALETEFVANVAEFRGVSTADVLNKFGRGGLLIAAEAVKVGMADRTGSYNELLAELTQEQQKGDVMSGENIAPPVAKETGTKTVTVDTLRADHSDLVASIEDSAKKAGYDEGYAAGAEAERKRIADIDAVAMPGHEQLVANAKEDGKTTADQLARQIVEAQKQRGANYVETVTKAATEIPEIEASGSNVTPSANALPALDDETIPVADRAKAHFDANKEIREEFRTVEAYTGYLKGKETGRGRVKSAK